MKAWILRAAVTLPDLTMALCVLSCILALMHSLSVPFQTNNIDLFQALSGVGDILAMLHQNREKADEYFGDTWSDCEELAKCRQIKLVPSRVTAI